MPLISRVSSGFSKIQLFAQALELATLGECFQSRQNITTSPVRRARSKASSLPWSALVSCRQSCFLTCLETAVGETACHVYGVGRIFSFQWFLHQIQGRAADNLQPALCQQLQLVPRCLRARKDWLSRLFCQTAWPEHCHEENWGPALLENVHVSSAGLTFVGNFCYFCSKVAWALRLTTQSRKRITKGRAAFARLKQCFWNERSTELQTSAWYAFTFINIPLYDCEIWITALFLPSINQFLLDGLCVPPGVKGLERVLGVKFLQVFSNTQLRNTAFVYTGAQMQIFKEKDGRCAAWSHFLWTH